MLLTHLFETAEKSTIDPVLEQNNPEDYDDYEDEDQDLRLRSGDYVRDSQDGEYGEVFKMQGDPTERRVQILDRDGRGWYITPDRLVPVDRNDPDVQRYFGKQRVRDIDEMDKSQPSQERHGDRALGAKGTAAKPVAARKVVKDLAMDLDQAFAKQKPVKKKGVAESAKPGEYYIHTVYFKDGTKKRIRVTSDEFDVADYYTKRGQAVDRVDYDFQLHSDTTEGATNSDLDENLRDWFGKEKWVRMDTKGNIKGDCARGSSSEGKPKCLPQAKAHALGKKGRASAAQKKRRKDPNPERRGKAINVATKVKEDANQWELRITDQWEDDDPESYGKMDEYAFDVLHNGQSVGRARANNYFANLYVDLDNGKSIELTHQKHENHPLMKEYERLVWGLDEGQDLDEACWKGYHKDGMKTMFGKRYPNCVKNKNESLEVYVNRGECPGCGGAMVAEDQITEKQDACYHKVKSRYKVWPSAYASGALVQCRKKGASNWGNKKEDAVPAESVEENQIEKTATGIRHRARPGVYGGAERESDPLRTLDKQGTNRIEKSLGVKFDREKKYQGGIDVGNTELDEVSTDTLGRYVKLAGIDVANRASASSYKSGAAGDAYNKADPSRQEISRERGIDRAIRKLTR